MMELHAPKRQKRKILGRGPSSGRGKTSGRGQKGQNARSGGGVRQGFEGGQMPLYRRIARRGFSNHRFRKQWAEISLAQLEQHYQSGEIVSIATLSERGLINAKTKLVKILANGTIDKPIILQHVGISAGAAHIIEDAGGRIEPITDRSEKQIDQKRNSLA